MRFLLSNDDSIYSKGILALIDAVHEYNIFQKNTLRLSDFIEGTLNKNTVNQNSNISISSKQKELTKELIVVAPELEQSAKSHSFTLREPLLIKRVPYHLSCGQIQERISLTGTPADSVYFAAVSMGPFDWVISGINHGSNLGSDVHYSGTVAAAREAALRGIPAIAVSLHPFEGGAWDFRRAATYAVELLFNLPLPPKGSFYNLNIPDLPPERELLLRLANVGHRFYESQVDVRKSPSGSEYCWIGGPPNEYRHEGDSDVPLCEQGYATLSLIKLDCTDYEGMEHLKNL